MIREKCERVPKTDAGALKTTPLGRTCLWRKLLPPDGLTSPGQLSQGGCARPPARLSTSTHNTHTPGRTRRHLSAVHSSPQRASMSRNDTWHSRVRGNTPAQQPPGVPASTGSAGDGDWQKKEGSDDPPGAQPAAAVRRLHVPLPLRDQSFRLHNSCSISPLRTTAAPSALRLFTERGRCPSRRPGPVQMMGGGFFFFFQELRRTTVLDF